MTGRSEASVARDTMSALAAHGSVLFRTNSGKAWLSALGPRKGIRHLADGSMHILAPRPMGLGLALLNGDTVPGLSDKTGWTTMVIKPEWVGRKIAVFTAAEDKREKNGRVSDDQRGYLGNVSAAGGIAILANSAESAVDQIKNWQPPPA